MKNSKIIFIIFLSVLCFYGSKVSAIKFPDSKTLQPLPNESAPNISGNIDWPNSPQDQTTDNADPLLNQNVTSNNSNPSGSSFYNDSGSTNVVEYSNSSQTIGNNTNVSNTTGSSGTKSGTASPSNSSGNNQQNFNPSYPSSYNFPAAPSQPGTQNTSNTSNTSAENDESPNNSVVDQNNTQQQTQKGISESTYAWSLAFGSMILLLAAFVLWRLKKIPNDVN